MTNYNSLKHALQVYKAAQTHHQFDEDSDEDDNGKILGLTLDLKAHIQYATYSIQQQDVVNRRRHSRLPTRHS